MAWLRYWHRSASTRTIGISLLVVSLITMPGCGSSSDPQNSTTSPANSASPGNPAAQATATGTSNTAQSAEIGNRRPNERWTDANGVEYLGNVPLDVFFDSPYTVASNGTAIAGGNAVAGSSETAAPLNGAMTETTADVTAPVKDTATPGEPSAPATSWPDLIPADELLAEVNEIRNFMTPALQSVGSYNSSMLMIPPKAASLAALAEIAADHPEDISWKSDARYIRDLAEQMNATNLQRGRKDQSRLQLLFENIVDTLNRSRPANLEEPDPDKTFADVAEMRLVMMRMADAERRMKNEAGSESSFASKKEMVRHEAVLLGALSKVVTIEGYGYADDDEFVSYADNIIEATQAIRTAIETSDFSSYDQALTKISTNCQECHSVYKNN